jgi:DNA sulfur modification protein DndE
MIETVRLSEKARNQLLTLKRHTGIENWNTLCRWAFIESLKDQKEPPNEQIPSDSSVEMSWRTFTGGNESIYLTLVLERALKAGIELEPASVNNYFRLHLHRGISLINSSTQHITLAKLVNRAA